MDHIEKVDLKQMRISKYILDLLVELIISNYNKQDKKHIMKNKYENVLQMIKIFHFMFNLNKVKSYTYMELVNMDMDFGLVSNTLQRKVHYFNNHNGWDWPD